MSDPKKITTMYIDTTPPGSPMYSPVLSDKEDGQLRADIRAARKMVNKIRDEIDRLEELHERAEQDLRRLKFRKLGNDIVSVNTRYCGAKENEPCKSRDTLGGECTVHSVL